MGSSSDPFAGGFIGAMGTIFGTLIGRVFLGAVVVLSSATVGTKLGRTDPWTGQDDAQTMHKHQLVHDRVNVQIEQVKLTCTNHRLKLGHEAVLVRLDHLDTVDSELRRRMDELSHKHIQEWRD